MNRYTWKTLVLEIVMILAAAVFVFPLWMLISVGFRPAAEVAKNPMGIPTSLNFDNFVGAWVEGELGSAFLTSALITVVSVLVLVVIGASGSYYFARSRGVAGMRWYAIVAAGMMVPFQIGLLPLYRIMANVGLTGNPIAVILISIGIHLPLTVILYTGFIKKIPPEYEEAARVDGATPFQAFWRIVVPMLMPITGTVIILNGIGVWNEFFLPLLYLSGTDSVTIPVRVYGFVGEYGADWGKIFAGLLMASLPVLVLFFLFQRYMIKSFGSGLKG